MDEHDLEHHEDMTDTAGAGDGLSETVHVAGGVGHSHGADVIASGDISWPIIICMLLLAVNCAMLGVLLLMKRLALLVDALAHSVLPGVVAAHIFKLKYLTGGLIAGVISLLLARWLAQGRRVQTEAGMAVVFAGMMALGYWLLTQPGAAGAPDLTHWLFGNPYDLGRRHLPWLFVLMLFNTWLISGMVWEFAATTLDPDGMKVLGVNPARSELVLLVMTVITVVVSTSMIGLVLTLALTAGPALIALLFPVSLMRAMSISLVIAAACTAVALALAKLLGAPLGIALVLIITIVTLAAVLVCKYFSNTAVIR